MLLRSFITYARPFLIGTGILFLAFFLLLIYALMVMSSREDREYEAYDWADQARAIAEWKNKRKARQAR